MNKQKTLGIIIFIIISCSVMAVIETIIEPTYVIKSAAKVLFFLIVPLIFLKLQNGKIFNNSFKLNAKNIIKLSALGAIVYVVIMVAFFLTRGLFDYSALVESLSADQQVSPGSFIWIAMYISFCNSLLEEFMFRYVAFIKLSEFTTKTIAYIFSSVMFSVYHIAMIGSSFPLPLLLLSLVGLAVGGAIFNFVDDKNKNIYNSWIVHMFADFAIMTIWFIHI